MTQQGENKNFYWAWPGRRLVIEARTQGTQRPHTDRSAARLPVQALYGLEIQQLPPLAWLDAVLPVPPPFS